MAAAGPPAELDSKMSQMKGLSRTPGDLTCERYCRWGGTHLQSQGSAVWAGWAGGGTGYQAAGGAPEGSRCSATGPLWVLTTAL